MNSRTLMIVGAALVVVVLLALVVIKPFGHKPPAAQTPVYGQFGGPTLEDRQKAIDAEAKRGDGPKADVTPASPPPAPAAPGGSGG